MRHDPPYCKAYPLVRRPEFKATERGYRDRVELAELLFLSPQGLTALERCGGRGFAPKRTRKSEGGVPAGAYCDAEVGDWLVRRLSVTGQWWLAFYQHKFPSKATETEAEASARALNEAYQIAKK